MAESPDQILLMKYPETDTHLMKWIRSKERKSAREKNRERETKVDESGLKWTWRHGGAFTDLQLFDNGRLMWSRQCVSLG